MDAVINVSKIRIREQITTYVKRTENFYKLLSMCQR